MELLSPTRTLPDTWAEGAIQLVLATLGTLLPALTTGCRRVTAAAGGSWGQQGASGGIMGRLPGTRVPCAWLHALSSSHELMP